MLFFFLCSKLRSCRRGQVYVQYRLHTLLASSVLGVFMLDDHDNKIIGQRYEVSLLPKSGLPLYLGWVSFLFELDYLASLRYKFTFFWSHEIKRFESME